MHFCAVEAYMPVASASMCEKNPAKPEVWSVVISHPHITSLTPVSLFPPNSLIDASLSPFFFNASAAAAAAVA